MKKALYTLDINGYSPEITEITYPRFASYARKIGADFHIIKDRKFPDNDIEYEKLQIYELGKEYDWNIYIDSDALLYESLFDVTAFLTKDTVMHYGIDKADERWTLDKYFLRDGRMISSCNWFAVASNWCLDLWHPPEIAEEEAIRCIHPLPSELEHGVTAKHLVSDYLLSRNIARFGLKVTTFQELSKKIGREGNYFYHQYTIPLEEKIVKLRECVKIWKRIDRGEKPQIEITEVKG